MNARRRDCLPACLLLGCVTPRKFVRRELADQPKTNKGILESRIASPEFLAFTQLWHGHTPGALLDFFAGVCPM